jgi:hypothetical protein
MSSPVEKMPRSHMCAVNGRLQWIPGETWEEAIDFLKMSFWMCGKPEPRVERLEYKGPKDPA